MATLFSKLQYKGSDKLLLRNAPDEFQPLLAELDDTVRIDTEPVVNETYSFALVFAKTSTQIEELAAPTVAQLSEDGVLWFAYPKKSSKRYKDETDINRDHGWQPLGDLNYEPVRQVAIDADWSALRFRPAETIKTMVRKSALSEAGRQRISESREAKP